MISERKSFKLYWGSQKALRQTSCIYPLTTLEMQFRSLTPYVTVAGKSLAISHEDKNRFGTLTRAPSGSHIASLPKASWMKYTMTRPDPARKSSGIAGSQCVEVQGSHFMEWISWLPQQPIALLQDQLTFEIIIDDCVRLQQLSVSQITPTKHIFIILWKLQIYRLINARVGTRRICGSS